MPSSGPVYQPTTVQYEAGSGSGEGEGDGVGVGGGIQRNTTQCDTRRWCSWLSCPKQLSLSHRGGGGANASQCFNGYKCLLWASPILGLAATAVGLKVTIDSANADSTNNLLVHGIILLLFGIACLILFAYLFIRRQRGWIRGKSGIEAGSGGGGASLGASNPSTDPLVAAQYAPVKDAPPSVDDECRQLMDNKDCLSSAEESDKMVESDPRIVLKPLKNTEDA